MTNGWAKEQRMTYLPRLRHITLLLACCLALIMAAGCGGSPTAKKADFKNKSEKQLFSSGVGNFVPVGGGGKSPRFTLKKASLITAIQTLHLTEPEQKAPAPGKISLKDLSGKTYGPWQAKGFDLNTFKNAFWRCAPDAVLEPGTYTIVDSDPKTWSRSGTDSSDATPFGVATVMGKQ